MARFKHTAHRVSMTAMFSAMSLLCMYLSSIIPFLSITLLFLSSVFVMGLLMEEEVALSFMMFAVVSGLSLLLMPLTKALPYIIFFGHYGIGKYLIEKRIKDKVVRYVLKLIYFNVALVLAYLFVRSLFLSDIEGTGLPLWAIIVIAEAAFIIYDFLFTKAAGYYFNNIRRFLIRS